MGMDPGTDDSDDELIARLRKEGGEPVKHDPFFDLPVAKEVRVSGPPPVPGEPGCGATAKRTREVPGLVSYPVAEQIRCELAEGHSGDHQACFTQSRFRHRWSALEWPSAPI